MTKQDCCELKYRKIKKKIISEIKYVMRKNKRRLLATTGRNITEWTASVCVLVQ